MKNYMTLIVAFVLLALNVNAQTILLQESFEESNLPDGWTVLDRDGDGYNWKCQTTITYGPLRPHTGSGCICSQSWEENQATILYPDNWLVTPAVHIEEGTAAKLTFYACEQDIGMDGTNSENYGVYVSHDSLFAGDCDSLFYATAAHETYDRISIDLSAYAGQTIYVAIRHWNTSNNWILNIDDVTIQQISEPMLEAQTDTVNFGEVGSAAVQTFMVTGYNIISGDITATVQGTGFSVSADGADDGFGITAILPDTGGLLYVKYMPEFAGAAVGNVVLTAEDAAPVTVALLGFFCEPVTAPATENFENPVSFDDDGYANLLQCWNTIDADDDGECWEYWYEPGFTEQFTHGGAGFVVSFNNVGYESSTDDWLITRPVHVGSGHTELSFWIAVLQQSYSSPISQHFGIYVSTEGNSDTDDFVPVLQDSVSGTYVNKTVSLDAFADKTIYIAFRHYGSDGPDVLALDDIAIIQYDESSITATPAELVFDVEVGHASVKQVNVTASLLTEDITATVSVSAFTIAAVNEDGNFGQTAVLPVTGGVLYVKYDPSVGGIDNEHITLISGMSEADVTLTGRSVDCASGFDLPYRENFDEGTMPRCWTTFDADGDAHGWMPSQNDSDNEFADPQAGAGCMFSESSTDEGDELTPDNWLISPAIALNSLYNTAELSFYVMALDTPEIYGVYVSVTGTDVGDFVPLLEDTATYFYHHVEGSAYDYTTSYEHVSINLDDYMGQTIHLAFRHYNSDDKMGIAIDEVMVLPGPTVTVEPMTLDFVVETGHESVKQAIVRGSLLDDNIQANIPAGTPFSISADGESFGQTVVLDNTGGTLYVKYMATSVSVDTAAVILTSGDAEAITITLTGRSVDCAAAIIPPYREGFDDGVVPPCWFIYDADDDGHSWENYLYDEDYPMSTYDGSAGMMISASSPNVAPTPDNWLVTPLIALGQDPVRLSFRIAAQDMDYPENFGVFVTTSAPDDLGSYTPVLHMTAIGEWIQYNIDLRNYAEQNIHIAFRHYHCPDIGGFYLKLDDVVISSVDSTLICNAPANLTCTGITDSSVVLSWTSTATDSDWVVMFRPAGQNADWISIPTQYNPCRLPFLEPNTSYEAMVCTNCDVGVYSAYTGIVTFTTASTGMDEHALSNALLLYPNPTSAYIDVEIGRSVLASELRVYDMHGRLLRTVRVNGSLVRIDVSGLESGVYCVRAITEKGVVNKMFVKK